MDTSEGTKTDKQCIPQEKASAVLDRLYLDEVFLVDTWKWLKYFTGY